MINTVSIALLEIQMHQKTLQTELFGLAVTFSLSLIVTEQTKSGLLTGSTLNRKGLAAKTAYNALAGMQ